MTYYEQGFLAKCAEYGVSEQIARKMLKCAQSAPVEQTKPVQPQPANPPRKPNLVTSQEHAERQVVTRPEKAKSNISDNAPIRSFKGYGGGPARFQGPRRIGGARSVARKVKRM